ncbi:MAG: glycolate oxidase subunit GlcE [Burkholderiales bacterium]|nr:glycolate oxidase subunit GlcE [Burkholderiales bacterium]
MTIETWQAQIKQAAARGGKLAIRGSGSKAFCSPPASPTAVLLDIRAHAGVVEYEPNELVIVVRTGTALAEVERVMTAAGQMLAFEAPHFGPGATIGGALASGLSGPRRPYAGALRDFVLGCKVVDGKGEHLAFGGKVMKNVAGFDVARLLAGSHGTFGVLTEVAFKCLPLPQSQQTRVFELGAEDAVVAMNRWYAAANPITASVWVGGRLYVRLAGAEPAVRLAATNLGGEALADDARWWRDWREQGHPFFAASDASSPLIRVSCKATAAFGDLGNGAEKQAIDWGGAQRWLRASSVALPAIREWARANGGFAQVFRGAAHEGERVSPLPAALVGVQQKLKQSFDPYGVFPNL